MGWKKLSSKLIYKNPWIRLREDKVIRPDGSPGIYSVVETNGPVVMIVPLTDSNETFIIRQFRYTTQMDSWELPGGNSDGEDLVEAAKRELKEETGLVANNWVNIGHFQTMNGLTSELGYVFIARNLKQTSDHNKSEEGVLEMKKVPFVEGLNMVRDSKITDGQSIVAFAKAYLYLKSKQTSS